MTLRTLYQALLDSDLARLRVIARQWGVTLTAERRADVAAELADAMTRVDTVERAWSALSVEQQAALKDLLQTPGGAMPWGTFTRRWGRIRAIGPGRLEREELWRSPVSPTEGVWYWGFLQRAFEHQDVGAVEVAFIPEELRLYLFTPEPKTTPQPEPTAPPLYQTLGYDTLADELVMLWSALHISPVKLTAAGSWPKQRREELLRRFSPPAELRLSLLETLALENEWLRQDPQTGIRPVADPLVVWLQADAWTQWSQLARSWIESRRWNDLAVVPTLDPDPAKGWPDVFPVARKTFLGQLRNCIPGVWYAIKDFVTYVRTYATDYLHPDGDYDRWILHDALTGAALRGFDAWTAIDGALVSFLLTGPLAWLGLVDLGGDSPFLQPYAFRLNSAGAAVLSDAVPPELPEPPPLRIALDGIIWVAPRRRYERFQLSRVAQPVRQNGDYGYRFTPGSLSRARRQGISVARICEFLADTSGVPVSESLRQALEATYQQGELARLERNWLLRVRDPDVLAIAALRPFIQERLSDTTALVRNSDREQVLSLLTQAGVLTEVVSK